MSKWPSTTTNSIFDGLPFLGQPHSNLVWTWERLGKNGCKGSINAQNSSAEIDALGDRFFRQLDFKRNKTTLRSDHHHRWG